MGVACAPFLALTPAPAEALRIVGSQDTAPRTLFGPRELVVINGGTQAGVQLGQEYFIRRMFRFGAPSSSPAQMVHTTGWLRIVAVNDATAIAQTRRDLRRRPRGRLPRALRGTRRAGGESHGGRLGDARLLVACPRDVRGRRTPHRRHRRFHAARYAAAAASFPAHASPCTGISAKPGLPLTAVGEGVIVSVTNGSPLMRITAARDAVDERRLHRAAQVGGREPRAWSLTASGFSSPHFPIRTLLARDGDVRDARAQDHVESAEVIGG